MSLRRVLLALTLTAALVAGLLVAAASSRVTAAPAKECAPKDKHYAWFCFGWAKPQSKGGSGRWLVSCSKATTAQGEQACEAVADTLERPAPDKSASVLWGDPAVRNSDSPAMTTNPQGQVVCENFDESKHWKWAKKDRPRWRAKSRACKALRGYILSRSYVPPAKDCADEDYMCRLESTAKWIFDETLKEGIAGLAQLSVWAATYLMVRLAKFLAVSAPPFAESAFYWTYNEVAGLMLFVVALLFLFTTAINTLRVDGPGPAASLGGLVRAFLGIICAGGIAWTVVWAWDAATNNLLMRHAATWDPAAWGKALDKVSADTATMLLAILLATGMIIGLLLLLVQLMFRGLLVTAAALFGAVAMAGQVMPETRVWGRRWFWTVNALASSKYFAMVIWVYASRVAVESDDVWVATKAVLMIWLMALAPSMIYKLTAAFDSYMADVSAHGMLALAGGAAGGLAGKAFGGKSSTGGSRGGAVKGSSRSDDADGNSGDEEEGKSSRAAELLGSADADIPTNPTSHTPEDSAAQTGPAQPPILHTPPTNPARPDAEAAGTPTALASAPGTGARQLQRRPGGSEGQQ